MYSRPWPARAAADWPTTGWVVAGWVSATAVLPGRLRLGEQVWRTRHRWVTAVLLVHLPLLAAWTLTRDVPTSRLLLLALPGSLYLLAAAEQVSAGRLRVPRALASCAAAAGLMACSSYLVSISGGYTEAHFHFFVMIPVVALYEDWAPFSVAVAWVLLEHGLVGTAWPHHVYGHSQEHMAHPWRFAAVHAGFFAAACIGSLTSWTLAERARSLQQDLLEQLRHRTLHDDLTGLGNRVRLAEAMDAAVASGEQVAVLLLDLDKFKDVNDTLGHTAGDELLRAVSERAIAAVTSTCPTGVLVRLGGDEFAVLLSGPCAPQALRVALRLRAAVSRATSLTLAGTTRGRSTTGATEGPSSASAGVRRSSVMVNVSIGIATRPARRRDIASAFPLAADEKQAITGALLREADVAMYTAKRAGSGIATYEPALDAHSADRVADLADFRRALDADDQIVAYFQPKVSVATGALVGVEALARWQHPTRGTLPPAAFIAMATSPELSEAFTRKVLTEALFQCRAWLRQGYQVPVSVNVTPHCLLRPSFAFDLADLLACQGVPAHLLCLEITEDALISDPDTAVQVLAVLRSSGVRCSIDDFGTGYSSLSYLRRLPIDEIKIDRSFVLGLFPAPERDDLLPATEIDAVMVGAVGVSALEAPPQVNTDDSAPTDAPDDATAAGEGADEVMVASIIDMGHRLGVHVVAEGVEQDRELAVLARLGCDSVQGYLHSPPVPANRFPAQLLRSAPRVAPSAGYQPIT